MRILLIIESAGGGSGRHVIDLARGLLRVGHVVTVVYSPLRAEPSFITRLRELENADVHSMDMQIATGWHDVSAVTELRRFIVEQGPFDVMHAHSSKAGALLRLANLGKSTPCVYTPHALVTLDDDLPLLKRWFFMAAERALATAAERIICVSEEEAEHAEAIGIPQDKLRVVNNGVDPLPAVDRKRLRRELGIADDDICVGTVGRLTHAKAVDRLISAFAMLHQALPKLRVLIVGDGPDRAALESMARRVGVFDRTIFMGHADGQEIMGAMDIFVLCSRYEGFPYVLLEAADRGLPIVMTDVGGRRATVESGDNGFVVEQGHIEQMVRCISELASSRELRERMGNRSRRIADDHRIDRMLSGTIDVYFEVVSGVKPANEDQ